MRSDGDVAVVQEARGTALRALTQPGPKAETRQFLGLSTRRRFPDGRREVAKTRMARPRGYVSFARAQAPQGRPGDGEEKMCEVCREYYLGTSRCWWSVVGGGSGRSTPILCRAGVGMVPGAALMGKPGASRGAWK